MRRRGFVFSLDAFVAFSLILIAIQTMVLISASPAGYWKALLQAQFLAKDTLHDVSNVMVDNNGQSALGESSANIVSGHLDPRSRMIQISDKIIQSPYSYAYSYYDTNTDNVDIRNIKWCPCSLAGNGKAHGNPVIIKAVNHNSAKGC